jgi:hypothetical protein
VQHLDDLLQEGGRETRCGEVMHSHAKVLSCAYV